MADNKKTSGAPGKKKVNMDGGDIFEAPVFTVEPGNKQIRAGQKIVLRAQASGVPRPSYQWYHNGKKVAGAVSDRLVIAKPRSGDAGNYSCEAKNYAGKAMSQMAAISFYIERIPNFTIEPAGTLLVESGKPLELRVEGLTEKQAKEFSLRWVFNGKRIRGVSGLTLQFTEMKAKYEGEYKVVATQQTTIKASNVIKIKVTAISQELKNEETPTNSLLAEIKKAQGEIPAAAIEPERSAILSIIPTPINIQVSPEEAFFNPEMESDDDLFFTPDAAEEDFVEEEIAPTPTAAEVSPMEAFFDAEFDAAQVEKVLAAAADFSEPNLPPPPLDIFALQNEEPAAERQVTLVPIPILVEEVTSEEGFSAETKILDTTPATPTLTLPLIEMPVAVPPVKKAPNPKLLKKKKALEKLLRWSESLKQEHNKKMAA